MTENDATEALDLSRLVRDAILRLGLQASLKKFSFIASRTRR